MSSSLMPAAAMRLAAAWHRRCGGMHVIVCKERPHRGAQLRLDDVDGTRITTFATNTRSGQLADLELRHRCRARCEDRIRVAKTPGCATCRSGPSHTTRSGAPSSPSPAACCLDGDARSHRPWNPPLGTLEVPTAPVCHPRSPGPTPPNDRPAHGTGARPGDIGCLVIPIRQNHTSRRRTDAQATELICWMKDRGCAESVTYSCTNTYGLGVERIFPARRESTEITSRSPERQPLPSTWLGLRARTLDCWHDSRTEPG